MQTQITYKKREDSINQPVYLKINYLNKSSENIILPNAEIFTIHDTIMWTGFYISQLSILDYCCKNIPYFYSFQIL